MLGSEQPLVRWQASDALTQMAAQLRRRPRVRWATAFEGSAHLTFEELVSLAGERLQDKAPQRQAVQQRVAVAETMGLWRDEAVTPWLVQALEEDEEPTVRATAALALGKVKDREAVEALISALADVSVWVRRAAADALGTIGDPRAVPALREALGALEASIRDHEVQRQATAFSATGEAVDEQDLPPGDDAVGSDSSHHEEQVQFTPAMFRASLITALGNMRTARARSLLIRYTEDPEPEVRWRAARGLGQIGDASAVPALRQLLTDEASFFGRSISQVATLAIEAIEKDERGPLSLIRKGFFYLWHALRRRLGRPGAWRDA
ncbi:MAG: HEAT repeat domain-containing protein [Anaerolineae bacterium]|nr:HEAT repeat domain-containing protein [Anaerolineae bacterium]